MDSNRPSMKDALMRKIEAHEVSMRPKIYFTLKLVLLVVVALAVLVLSVFILNFILFSLRINNQEAFLGFGSRGIAAFIHFFPWAWLLIDIALIALLQWLVRQFAFGYKSPVLYMVLGLLVVTTSVAYAIDRGTDLNDRVLMHAEAHRLPPPFGMIYGGARHMPPPAEGVCTCIITAINGNTLILRDARGTTTITAVLPLDNPRATTTYLKIGDTVFVAGDIEEGVLIPYGVRLIRH